MKPPRTCLVIEPHPHSVDFAGVYINLKKLSVLTECSHVYLSRVFNGKRPMPRISWAKRLADALEMDLGDFVDALEERVRQQGALRSKKHRKVWADQHLPDLLSSTRT